MPHTPAYTCRALAMLLVFTLGHAASARDLFVAPQGTPDGDGSPRRPLDLATALSAKGPAKPGDRILLAPGKYDGPMDGITRQSWTADVAGTEQAPITISPAPGSAIGESAHLNGSVRVRGAYLHLINLEIGDLDWSTDPTRHTGAEAVTLYSPGVRVINCNLFGGTQGVGSWGGAVDSVVYGCLIHDFGFYKHNTDDRGHGHAFYAQNEKGTKTFEHNVLYRGCGWNIHIYTEGGTIHGFDIIENICFLPGALRPNQTVDNFLIMGYTPADRIRMIGNVGYQAVLEDSRPNARLATYGKDVINGSAIVRDNYLAGSDKGIIFSKYKALEFTGNTIWSSGHYVGIAIAEDGQLKIDGNTYIANGEAAPFGTGTPTSFEQWQARGFDTHGKVVAGKNNRPAGAKVFVYPNKFEKGRAHVAVFNWDGAERVEVDLSGAATAGKRYTIYNCADITQTIALAKPVFSGLLKSTKIALPMPRDPQSPNFSAFLVIPVR